MHLYQNQMQEIEFHLISRLDSIMIYTTSYLPLFLIVNLDIVYKNKAKHGENKCLFFHCLFER